MLVDRRVERLTLRLAGMEVRSEAHVVRLDWPGLGLPELAAQVGLGAMEEGVLDFHLDHQGSEFILAKRQGKPTKRFL